MVHQRETYLAEMGVSVPMLPYKGCEQALHISVHALSVVGPRVIRCYFAVPYNKRSPDIDKHFGQEMGCVASDQPTWKAKASNTSSNFSHMTHAISFRRKKVPPIS